MTETKESVIDAILERAENRPWRVVSAIYGKLPFVLMRSRKLSYDEALVITQAVVQSIGCLDDDMNTHQMRELLNSRIDF
jgi:hypothetical protein